MESRAETNGSSSALTVDHYLETVLLPLHRWLSSSIQSEFELQGQVKGHFSNPDSALIGYIQSPGLQKDKDNVNTPQRKLSACYSHIIHSNVLLIL